MNEELSRKIEALEKRLRERTRLFAALLAAVALVLAAVLMRYTTLETHVSIWPEPIMGERAEGGTIGVLAANGKHTVFRLSEVHWTEEAPSTSFTSRPRVKLVADDEQTGLLLYDRSGKVRARLVVAGDQPELSLLDETGKKLFAVP